MSTDALQAALAGEHAAIYAYGVVGARLVGQPDLRAASSAYNAHRQRRTTLSALVQSAGAIPTPAAVAYDLGAPVVTSTQARALAARVEAGCAATYADLVAAADGTTRAQATAWLQDAAVRGASWSGAAAVFPGMPERG